VKRAPAQTNATEDFRLPIVKKERGTMKLTIKSDRYYEEVDDELVPALPFREGENWWAIRLAAGPDSLLHMYGAKLAIDFFEFESHHFGENNLIKVLESMPKAKGPIEVGFIAEVERLAQWMANANRGGE